MKTHSAIWTLALACAPALWAQLADPAMLRADAAFTEALAKGDKTALASLLDDQFTWTNASGHAFSRADVLAKPPKPNIADAKGVEQKSYGYSDLGDVQVNQGREHSLHVWARRGGAWKLIVYQELTSLAASPTVTPGAGKECDNPCKHLEFTPRTDIERQVADAYMRLETAAHARDPKGFAVWVADEFVAASSNSDRLQTKQSRIQTFESGKDAGVAPTPLLSARMFPFGDAVLMVSEHKPDRGRNLHVTRIWVKRGGQWRAAISFQTAIEP